MGITVLSGDAKVTTANLDLPQITRENQLFILINLRQFLSVFQQDVSRQYDKVILSVWDLARGTDYII